MDRVLDEIGEHLRDQFAIAGDGEPGLDGRRE
jgi:hypothetical protein